MEDFTSGQATDQRLSGSSDGTGQYHDQSQEVQSSALHHPAHAAQRASKHHLGGPQMETNIFAGRRYYTIKRNVISRPLLMMETRNYRLGGPPPVNGILLECCARQFKKRTSHYPLLST